MSRNKKEKIFFILVEALLSGGVMRPFFPFPAQMWRACCFISLRPCEMKGEASGSYWETLEAGEHRDDVSF